MKELGLSREPKNKVWKNGPNPAAQQVIDETKKNIALVNYSVSLRWLFYRLLQSGILSTKREYDRYKNTIAKARHSGLIARDAIADAGRARINLSGVYGDVHDWTADFATRLRNGFQCVDLQHAHNPYVIVAFEAKAMAAQFEQYAKPYGVTLWPFGGDPSIPYKNELAVFISGISQDVVVLYFGDLDSKGASIGESAMRDVRNWSIKPFEAYLAGLTTAQQQAFSLPSNPLHPGAFQWEALSDPLAEQLITDAPDQFIDLADILTIRADEREELSNKADRIEG